MRMLATGAELPPDLLSVRPLRFASLLLTENEQVMVLQALPEAPSVCESKHDNKGEDAFPQISAGWHRPVSAEWQDQDGQSYSLSDLALSICCCPITKTAFFKLQLRVDIKGSSHYLFYLHIAPERIQRLALCSTFAEKSSKPNHDERCLRFQTSQPTILVAPCWPCHPKNEQSGANFHLLEMLGRASVFTLKFSIPCRLISDASFLALTNVLASENLKSHVDQANVERYYRGQGGHAIDLAKSSNAVTSEEHQPSHAGSLHQRDFMDQPPAYDQAVIEQSSSEPLLHSPPSKKRRRDSPFTDRDDLLAQSIKSLCEDLKTTVAENVKLAQTNEANVTLFRSKSEQFEKTVGELRDENHELRVLITTMNDKLRTLEQRLAHDGEELERRVDVLEDRVTSLDAWTEDHENDFDLVKDLAREVIEEDSEELFNRLISRLTDRLHGSC